MAGKGNWLLVGAYWMRGVAGKGNWLLVGANWMRGVAGKGILVTGGVRNAVCIVILGQESY